MATESVNPPNKNTPIQSPLSMRELATLLVKHFGLHEGRYDLTVEFKIGFGGVGPDLESLIPGAIIGLNKVGLTTTESTGGASVDAGEVNPFTKEKKRPSSKPK